MATPVITTPLSPLEDIHAALLALSDQIKTLDERVTSTHLRTVMGSSAEAGKLGKTQRARLFSNDAGFAGVANALGQDAKRALYTRAARVSKDMLDLRASTVADDAMNNATQYIDAALAPIIKQVRSDVKQLIMDVVGFKRSNQHKDAHFPQNRTAAIETFNQDLTFLISNHKTIAQTVTRIKQVQGDLDKLFDPTDITATAQDPDRIAKQLLLDSLEKQKVKLERKLINHFNANAESILAGSTSKQVSVDLAIPIDLATKGRGTELITVADQHIKKGGNRFNIIRIFATRTGHDYDPVDGTYWEPPDKADGYKDVDPTIRDIYSYQSEELYNDFERALGIEGLAPCLSTFNVTKDRTSCATVGDGVRVLYALITLYRPTSSTYREELEHEISTFPNKFTSGNPLDHVRTLRGKLQEAQRLGIHIKWSSGNKIVTILGSLTRGGTQYAVDLKQFQDNVPNRDDSASHTLDLLAQVEATSKEISRIHGLNWSNTRAFQVSARDCKFGDRCNKKGKGCNFRHPSDAAKHSTGGGTHPMAGIKDGKCKAKDCPQPQLTVRRGRDFCSTCFKKAIENKGVTTLVNGRSYTLPKAITQSATHRERTKERRKKGEEKQKAKGNAIFSPEQQMVMAQLIQRNNTQESSDPIVQQMESLAPPGPKAETRRFLMSRLGSEDQPYIP